MDEKFHKWAEQRWVVIGFTHEKAKEIIDDIVSSCGKEVSKRIINKNELRIEFADGTTLRHIRASENSRGNKFGKMWCDKDINKEAFYHVIMPMYFGDRDEIIWL